MFWKKEETRQNKVARNCLTFRNSEGLEGERGENVQENLLVSKCRESTYSVDSYALTQYRVCDFYCMSSWHDFPPKIERNDTILQSYGIKDSAICVFISYEVMLLGFYLSLKS